MMRDAASTVCVSRHWCRTHLLGGLVGGEVREHLGEQRLRLIERRALLEELGRVLRRQQDDLQDGVEIARDLQYSAVWSVVCGARWAACVVV